MKKFLLILLCITLFTGVMCTIDPVIDAERRVIMPQFLSKILDSIELAINNITVYAADDYTWCFSYVGCFGPKVIAQDYAAILFYEIPIFNFTTFTITYYRVAYVEIQVLSIDLVDDGELNDTYVINYVVNETQFNNINVDYNAQNGYFFTAYYVFAKNSTLISAETVFSTEQQQLVDSSSAFVVPSQLCTIIVGIPGFNGTCPVGSPYQQFSSFDDCVDKMTQVNYYQGNRTRICPDVQSSNTTACRFLHAITAGDNPPHSECIHCPHTQVPSPICIDRCDSVCDYCNVNATCKFELDIYGVKTYQCACSEGYTGDGVVSCQPVSCSARWQCGTGDYYNYANCNTTTQICYCQTYICMESDNCEM